MDMWVMGERRPPGACSVVGMDQVDDARGLCTVDSETENPFTVSSADHVC